MPCKIVSPLTSTTDSKPSFHPDVILSSFYIRDQLNTGHKINADIYSFKVHQDQADIRQEIDINILFLTSGAVIYLA